MSWFEAIQDSLKKRFLCADYMEFDRKLTDTERNLIGKIAQFELPDYKLLLINDFLDDRRHMRKYPAGKKKQKKQRPALSNHAEGC